MRFGRPGLLSLAILSLSPAAAVPAEAAECPAELSTVTKVIVVTAERADSFKATIDTYARASPTEKYKRELTQARAVIGRNGWAWGHAWPAPDGERKKVEGDGRSPAGLFKMGRPFGFASQQRPGYLLLENGKTFCVDDVRSEAYSRIVPRQSLPRGTTGEDMRTIPLYEHGFVIDYPSDRDARSGSCVFVHLWRTPRQGTAGCVAADRATVLKLQEWANDETARIAIFSKADAAKFVKCLQ
jgi:L,D-peptidoglycan transpeptidase YkuD (ErfK/YbiS/YcfS/YnhG family)